MPGFELVEQVATGSDLIPKMKEMLKSTENSATFVPFNNMFVFIKENSILSSVNRHTVWWFTFHLLLTQRMATEHL